MTAEEPGSAEKRMRAEREEFRFRQAGGDPDVTYYCVSCRKECKAKVEDFGIGAYEFWGQRCTDTRLGLVSACCREDVTEDNNFSEAP